MIRIIKELQNISGTNDKIKFLKKHKDNKTLQTLLKMTYDHINFKYHLRLTNIPDNLTKSKEKITLEFALSELNKLVSRDITGNEAKDFLIDLLSKLSEDDEYLIRCVINRDLRIDMGRTNINKAIPKLIAKQLYAGCNTFRYGNIVKKENKILNKLLDSVKDKFEVEVSNHVVEFKSFVSPDTKKKLTKILQFYPNGTYTKNNLFDTSVQKGTSHNINFPAIVQLKNDGSYREFSYFENELKSHSRSGLEYQYPLIANKFKKLKDIEGYFISELTIKMSNELIPIIIPQLEEIDKRDGTTFSKDFLDNWELYKLQGKELILPRNIGNGLLNSLEDKLSKGVEKEFTDIIQKNIVVDIWDYVTDEDYKLALLKDKKNPPKKTYKERFEQLKKIIKEIDYENIRVVIYKEVKNIREATEFASEMMKKGLEGAILKDWSMLFKDGRSNEQLKLKVKAECEMRVTGFIKGRKGTKREKTFGAMTFKNDDSTISGSVSGFTDSQLEDFNNRREELIGRIISIEFNDLTKARGNKTYSLSHPSFIELRDDKNTTDDLQTVKEVLESAKNFK